MPPKPRIQIRKSDIQSGEINVSTQKSSSTSKTSSSKMLPPPPPVPTTILGAEMQDLESSLKDAAVQTGRIFRFYADTRRERLTSHAPYPPKSIARSLGRALERYDRICDTVETQLLQAISVLQRDLKAEQARIEAEASAAAHTRSQRPSPTSSRTPLPNASPPPNNADQTMLADSPTSMLPPTQFPPPSGASAISLAPRRPSAILSSLHRPSFPLKLDLSAAALSAGNLDRSGTPMDVNVDLGLTSLPSPVTLAPKTARPIPNDPTLPDLFGVGNSQSMPSVPETSSQSDAEPMPGNVGLKTAETGQAEIIDLTVSEGTQNTAPQLGDSADKPIELDLEGTYDDMDLFGDVQRNSNTTETAGATADNNNDSATAQLDVDMDGLFTPQDSQHSAFQLGDDNNAPPDASAILASLTSNTGGNSGDTNVLSLLSGENQTTNNNDDEPSDSFPGLGAISGAEPHFDLSNIDLSSFIFDTQAEPADASTGAGNQEAMDLMSQLLAMDGGEQTQNSSSEDAQTIS